MPLSDYKLLSGDENSYLIQHPDGSSFSVAKNALSPDMHDKIQGLSAVEGAPMAPQAPTPSPLLAAVSGQPEAPQMEPSVPNVPVPVAPQTPMDELSKGYEEVSKKYGESFSHEAAAAAAAGQAKAEQAKQEAAAYKKQIVDMNSLTKDYQLDKALDDQNAADLQKSIMSSKIDPNQFWQNTDTGQKIGAAIAIGLGGFGAGLLGSTHNQALDVINSAIDRDIKAQEANLGTQKSMLDFYLKQGQTKQEAYLNTKKSMIDVAQAMIGKAAATSAGPQVLAAATQQIAQLERQSAGIDQQLLGIKMNTKIRTQPFSKELLGVISPEDAKKAVQLPDGSMGLAHDEKSASEVRDASSAYNSLKPVLDRLEALRTSPSIPLSEKKAEAESLVSSGTLLLNGLYGIKRLSPEEFKLMKEQFSDPTKLIDAVHGPIKTETLKKTLTGKLDAVLRASVPAYSSSEAVKYRRAQ